MSSQIKLLRLLQEQEYYPLGSDVAHSSKARITAATNANLRAKQEKGYFRKDLYFRLVAHHIHLPPLRERMEDLPLLIDHFLEEAASSLGKKRPSVPSGLYTLVGTYHFPGNVRELQSMIYDALSRYKGGVLSLAFFKDYMSSHRDSDQPAAEEQMRVSRKLSYSGKFPTLKEVEEFFISEALKKAGGNQSTAAQLLGISQSTLSRRLSGKSK
jgi:DNA-binding NtrC family response regulator